jgi:hypothetical protein
MSRTRRLTDEAFDDLDGLIQFFDRRAVGLGEDMRLEVVALLIRLAAQPFVCAAIDRPPRGRDVRQGMTRRFPVLVLYEVFPTEIVVLAVTHAKARTRTWRQRLRP